MDAGNEHSDHAEAQTPLRATARTPSPWLCCWQRVVLGRFGLALDRTGSERVVPAWRRSNVGPGHPRQTCWIAVTGPDGFPSLQHHPGETPRATRVPAGISARSIIDAAAFKTP